MLQLRWCEDLLAFGKAKDTCSVRATTTVKQATDHLSVDVLAVGF
jgi:hypothetical protein